MKQFLVLLLILASSLAYAQNGNVKGKVVDTDTKKPIPGATVNIGTYSAITDANGEFEVSNVPNGDYTVGILTENYEAYQVSQKFNFADGTSFSLPEITLKYKGVQEIGTNDITISENDLDGDNKDQNISGLLHSSDDIFNKVAGFNLSFAFFRPRGYDGEYSTVYMNGIQMNDPETGRASYSEWGGLNDVTRNKESVGSINPAKFSFGSIGGVTNINSRASLQRKQIKFSYAVSNRTYTNRAMLTYSTGLMQNGWAFTLSGSRRWAEEGYIKGTNYDAYAYFLGIEKKINAKHSVGLTAYGSPTERGGQSASTQETYDLLNDNYYNANWGWQNGEKRNAKIRKFHEPMFILNHYWKVKDNIKLTTAAAYTFGEFGNTSLNWYNAPDPRPDYYRYLPSYETRDSLAMQIKEMFWKNSNYDHQLDWNSMYQANYRSKLLGQQSRYIVENRRSDHQQINGSSVLNWELNSKLNLSAGLEFTKYKSMNFKVMEDLLGGEYWLDIDQFAERDLQQTIVNMDWVQNDLNNPNRIIKEGDKFGYNYNIHYLSSQVWAQAEATFNRVDLFLSTQFIQTSMWREGLMKNGRAPLNSFGNSDKKTFNDLGLKTGATFKITGRHFIIANAMYQTKAPNTRNAFLSPRIKNDYIKDLKSETIMSGEISYVWRSPKVKARVTAYQTSISDLTDTRGFYDDGAKTFVNYTMNGMDKLHRGFELGTEIKATSSVSFTAIGTIGLFNYTSRPTAQISYDNGLYDDTSEVVYIKDFKLAGFPVKAGSFGINWRAPKFWFVNANINFVGERYLDFFAQRRTDRAVDIYMDEFDPKLREVIELEKLKGGYTVDLSIGKSLRIKYKYFLNFNFSISNILDNKELITGGFEQARYDQTAIGKFDSKYYYAYGRTYFIQCSFRL